MFVCRLSAALALAETSGCQLDTHFAACQTEPGSSIHWSVKYKMDNIFICFRREITCLGGREG